VEFLKTIQASPILLLVNFVLSVGYFIYVAFFTPTGNPVLFGILVAASVFHLWQVLGYLHSVWPRKRRNEFDVTFTPNVGVFITVCGEPEDIIEATVIAAKQMDYPNFSVYILNDGLVANRDNWREAEDVAKRQGVHCITRETPGGAKAGNINHALAQTHEEFVVIFDADHIPKPHFLQAMMGYFVDERVGFVQSPQYYKNHDENQVTSGAWEQQALFFGAIMKGKNTADTAFMCGTNMVLRRMALLEAGGMCETSIAEDFLTSLLMHEKKWKSIYVGQVLAEGLAPEDFLSYYKQQFRWARGSLEVVFKYNPLFRRGLSMRQRIQYLASASYYLSGIVVVINAALPLVYFYAQIEPLQVNTMALALVFLPYIFVVLYTIQVTSNFSYTFRALAFSLSSFPIHCKAVWQIITGKKTGFVVTSKKKVSGNFGYLVTPHLVYIGLVVVGVVIGVIREGISAAVVTNFAWALIYIAIFYPFISAAFEKTAPVDEPAGEKVAAS